MSAGRTVTVVGGGTAGLVAAITLLHRVPDVRVTVVRSVEMGTIMVGEGTFAGTPTLMHDRMGIPRDRLFAEVNPVWKLGVRLLWGPRPYFDYPFSEQFDNQILPTGSKPWGYYHLDDVELRSAMCAQSGQTSPQAAGYHLENGPLVAFLESHFVSIGGELIDAKVTSVRAGGQGVESIELDSGAVVASDVFVDATGFRAELIAKTLGQSFVSMSNQLFCDRAVVGGWERGSEPVLPYTTMETMDAGWCWQIEHERVVNRGYVFSSAHLDDDDAVEEFVGKNPRVSRDAVRFVPFAARHISQAWVGNVIAIGNACGFVEPLEATNIQVICLHALKLAEALSDNGPLNPTTVADYNSYVQDMWVSVRDFLALHYRFNTRLTTPFWQMATHETPLGELGDYVAEYQRRGPVLHTGADGKPGFFGYDGALAILLGLRVPWNDSSVR